MIFLNLILYTSGIQTFPFNESFMSSQYSEGSQIVNNKIITIIRTHINLFIYHVQTIEQLNNKEKTEIKCFTFKINRYYQYIYIYTYYINLVFRYFDKAPSSTPTMPFM